MELYRFHREYSAHRQWIGAHTSSSSRRDVKTRNGKTRARSRPRTRTSGILRLIGKRDAAFASPTVGRCRDFVFFSPPFSVYIARPIYSDGQSDPRIFAAAAFADARAKSGSLTVKHQEREEFTIRRKFRFRSRAIEDDAQDRSSPVFIRATTVPAPRTDISGDVYSR